MRLFGRRGKRIRASGAKVPDGTEIHDKKMQFGASGEMCIEAARKVADGEPETLPTFSMNAYTGGPMSLPLARQALAELIRLLHGAGLVHRDLYLAHVFMDAGVDGVAELYLLDLQRVLRPRWRIRRWVVKDLAALHFSTPADAASAADRLRWLKHYRACTKLSADDRRLVRAIIAKTRRIARHSHKHGLG